MNRFFLLLILFFVLNGTFSGCIEQVTQKYNIVNPVLPGDRPDPSVVKIDDWYYATATSSEWSPLFPIFKSADLKEWELVSYVFPGGAPEWADNNFWAPELAYDEKQKKVYVYYTARDKKTNLSYVAVASADSPEGPFYDNGPLVVGPNGSIDPFETRDENGNLYLIWKSVYVSDKPAIIWAQRIAEDRSLLIGVKQEIIRNDRKWEKHTVEGPCIFKKGRYFYLMYSAGNCCDKKCDYKIGVARSEKLLGPWEKYEANPILTDTENWKCPGTGTVIEAKKDLYLLHHAYSLHGGDFVGREGILQLISWTDDEWPILNPSEIINSPLAKMNFEDHFSDALDLGWQWRATQKLTYATGESGLMLEASMENEQLGSLLVQPIKSTDFELTVSIDLSRTGPETTGGIALIGAANNGFDAPIAGIGITANQDLIQVWKISDLETNIYEAIPVNGQDDILELRMEVREGHLLRFSVLNNSRWKPIIDLVDASAIVPWGMGFRFGIVARGESGNFVNFTKIKLINR